MIRMSSPDKASDPGADFQGYCPVCPTFFVELEEHLRFTHQWNDGEIEQVRKIPHFKRKSGDGETPCREVTWDELERKQDGKWDIERCMAQTLIRLNKDIDAAYKELREKVTLIYARTGRSMKGDDVDGPRHDLISLVDVVLDPSYERFEKFLSQEIFKIGAELASDISLLL